MRYVLAVARAGNLRQAAGTLHIAMQSLSEQVAAVEREVGVALFTRSRAGMALTPAGEVFTAQATVALEAAQDVLDATKAAATDAPAPVRIAVATGLSGVTGELLRHYLVAQPAARVRLAELRSSSQAVALREGEIAAGVAHTPPGPLRGVLARRIRTSPIYALLRADDPLAAAPAVSLRDLAARPMLLPSHEDAATMREQILAMFTERGLTPVLGRDVHGYDVAAAFVAAGLGYTLCVPALQHDPDLTSRPLVEDVAPFEISLLTRRGDRTVAALALLAAARAMGRAGDR